MDNAPPSRKVTRYRLTSAIAEKRIKSLAEISDNIAWSFHALQRMSEREIFDADVLRILRGGSIENEPEEARQGEWKCKMVRRLRGSREAGVVVIILRADRLLVKTVEWEDV